jgi:hypothetical protein
MVGDLPGPAASVDVLFVDEAGQMSLANVLAVSSAASSLVLLGDPQQLEQPEKATHPDGVGISALEHVLAGHATMPADKGIFLPVTWRMSPGLTQFTSEVFYEKRLTCKPGLECQKLTGLGSIDGSGFWIVPVEHDGNQSASDEEVDAVAPREQHFTILYGDTGYSYESIMGPYLQGAKAVVIEDPYIRLQHQIQNFVRFCETVLKAGTVKNISLITGHDDKTPLAEMAEKLEELKQSLLELDVELEVKLNPNIHDREIRLDNGWIIKIGRGLDFYQKPSSWFEVGAHDLNLRKCLETKVDIFKAARA